MEVILSFLPTLYSCSLGQCSLGASFENKLSHDVQYSVYLQRVYDSGVMIEAGLKTTTRQHDSGSHSKKGGSLLAFILRKSGVQAPWNPSYLSTSSWQRTVLRDSDWKKSLNKRVENPGINGMLKININYKGKMQAHLLGLFPPHVYSPNCHRPTPAKNPPRYCSLDYGYYRQTKDRIGGSLAKEQERKR
uniref:Uncharacterized protein n=1 Tax=Salix viminalis TaxID=40686 RepID=A0A6N2MUJ2_SALVM